MGLYLDLPLHMRGKNLSPTRPTLANVTASIMHFTRLGIKTMELKTGSTKHFTRLASMTASPVHFTRLTSKTASTAGADPACGKGPKFLTENGVSRGLATWRGPGGRAPWGLQGGSAPLRREILNF